MGTRTSPRANCHIPCRVDHNGARVEGTVLNLSDRGMLLSAPGEFEEGDELVLELEPKRGAAVLVGTLVWHSRQHGEGKQSLVGLIVSEPTLAYTELVARTNRGK